MCRVNLCATSGLFQAKLNSGEGGLSAAISYDVATLIKQFCRELPEPLFPAELHEALLRARSLSVAQDRTSALQLLSCLLPARNSSCLHYLFNFLSKVSQRYMTAGVMTPQDQLPLVYSEMTASLAILTIFHFVFWLKGFGSSFICLSPHSGALKT